MGKDADQVGDDILQSFAGTGCVELPSLLSRRKLKPLPLQLSDFCMQAACLHVSSSCSVGLRVAHCLIFGLIFSVT